MSRTTYTPETHPDWSIEEALKRADFKNATVRDVRDGPTFYSSILAHAYDIARHEQPPVDKPALILADYWKALGLAMMADDLREGARNYAIDVTALRKALEKHGMLKGPTQ